MPDTSNFAALLAAQEKAFAEAKVFDKWMPEDGRYACFISKADQSPFKENGLDVPAWRITVAISAPNNPDIDSREFDLFMSVKALGIVKQNATALAGQLVSSIYEADKVIMSSVGCMVTVDVKRSIDKKDKKTERCNANIVEVTGRPAPAAPTA